MTAWAPEAVTKAPVAILTGAGASASLGYPTTAEFLPQFTNAAVNHFNEQRISSLALRLMERASHERWDIEHVLDLLERLSQALELIEREAGDSIQLDATSLAYMRQPFEELRDFVYDEVVTTYERGEPGQAAQVYAPLLRDFPSWFVRVPGIGRTLPWFTLNYDRSVELAASTLDGEDGEPRVALVDGLGPSRGHSERRWSRERFLRYQEEPEASNVVFVKLHGSVRWGRTDDGSIVELPPGLPRDPGGYRRVVLYPSLVPKPLRDDPFRTGYRLLDAWLQRGSVLIVIGCSLRDPELAEALRRATEDNERLRFVVASPHADATRVAARLGVPLDHVAAFQSVFQPATSETVDLFMDGLRRLAVAAVTSPPEAAQPEFGRTYAPGETGLQLVETAE